MAGMERCGVDGRKKECNGMMKNMVNRALAGIGYGFLAGAAGGLLVGVLANRLFFWIAVGGVAGVVVGWIVSVAVIRRIR